MTGVRLAALDRLSPRIGKFVVAAGALLAVAAVMAGLRLTIPHSGHKRQPSPRRQAPAGSLHAAPRQLPPPVPTAAMLQVRQVAERFLVSHLPFGYRRGSALAIRGITLELRRELL
jgi:hypothetical protein